MFYENSPKHINYYFSNKVLNGSPNKWAVNIDKLKAFGFEPHYSITEGIKKTSIWLQENYPLE